MLYHHRLSCVWKGDGAWAQTPADPISRHSLPDTTGYFMFINKPTPYLIRPDHQALIKHWAGLGISGYESPLHTHGEQVK